jgi:hypothetical protein
MSHDDALSLSMFWAGALMVFAPLLFAGAVIGTWWWGRKKAEKQTRDQGTEGPGTGE